jgi:hypothetical protein
VEYLTADPAEPATRPPAADVRDVPLEQLAGDADSQERVERGQRVAMFNSAI